MTPAVTVRGLLDARPESVGLSIELLAGASGLHRQITSPYIQKTGLALAGFHEYLQAGRILLFGESEVRFLERLDSRTRSEALLKCFNAELPCLLVTGGADVAPEIVAEGERANVPVLRTTVPTAAAIGKLTAVLEDRLAHREIIHGVLVDILGLGVLIVGESGIGKSECALELIMRGHRLVADDVVHCDWRPPGLVFGVPDPRLAHHLEIRGLGILDVKEIFGITSTRERKRIDLVARLVEWNEEEEYERLGIDDEYHRLLEVPIREVTVPVRPARDLGAILEIAARNELLRRRGVNSSKDFIERLRTSRRPGPGVEAPSHIPVPVPSYLDVTTHEVAWDTNDREESGALSGESHAWVMRGGVGPKGGT